MTTNSVLSMKDMLCHLCGSVYEDPKMLACLHNFCINCLADYLLHTTKENKLICPQCRMETNIQGSDLEALPVNTFVKRHIREYGILHAAPMQSDAENENRELTEMNLSSTASSSADEKEESSHNEAFLDEGENVTSTKDGWMPTSRNITDESYNTTIDGLHNRYMQLQTKALQITYAIDSVNRSVDDWKENRCRVKEDIQRRSQYLQSLVRLLERKLIADLDSSSHMDEIMNEVTNTKEKLQDILKLTLHNIQFIRHLINTGLPDDIMYLGKSVLKMQPIGQEQDITLRFPEYKVECSRLKQESHLEEVFGELSKIWKEKVIMANSNSKMEVTHPENFLSDNPADLTRSMIVEKEKPRKALHSKQYTKVGQTSSIMPKKNLSRRGHSESGSKSHMLLNDAEKNIYLKYEVAKKNLEKRRRELAVKHMIGNKSRSQDEGTNNVSVSNEKCPSDVDLSKVNKNLNVNKQEAELKFTEKMLHAGSESNFSMIEDQIKRADFNCDKKNGRRWSSGSPMMAAQVTMARNKVSSVLRTQQVRSNSVSPQRCENSEVSPTTKKRSPSIPEIVPLHQQQKRKEKEVKVSKEAGGCRRETDEKNVVVEEKEKEEREEKEMDEEEREEEEREEEEREEEERKDGLGTDSDNIKRMSRIKFQQVKENVRRKNEQWRSVSASN